MPIVDTRIYIMSTIKEFYPQLLQKGYTEREVRQNFHPIVKEVPNEFQDRFDTYEEYLEHLHDYLNGI